MLGIPPQNTGDMTQLKYRAQHTRIIAYGYDLKLHPNYLLFCSTRIGYTPYATKCMLHPIATGAKQDEQNSFICTCEHGRADDSDISEYRLSLLGLS